MKSFIIKVTLIAIVSYSVIQIIDLIMLYSVDRWSYNSHERNVLLAYNRLSALKDTNKIIIIAGSNGALVLIPE